VSDALPEKRFERALRWYPRSWREQNQDAVLATLLDVAEAEGRDAPRHSEIVNLALNGLSARAGIALPAAVRDPAASFALATGAAFALVMFVGELRGPWRGGSQEFAYSAGDTFGVFDNTGVIVYGLWLIAFVLTIARRTGLVRAALGLAMLASVVLTILRFILWRSEWVGPNTTTAAFLFVLGLVAVAGRPRSRRALGLQAPAILLVLSALWAVNWSSYRGARADTFFWWRPASDYTVGVTLVLVLLLALGLAGLRRPTLAGILALSAAPWFVEFLVYKAGHAQDGWLFTAVVSVPLIAGGLLFSRYVSPERPPQPFS
jgi:hypothetical protein